MPKVLVSKEYLQDIADAIRGKNGKTETYTPAEMAGAITALSGTDAWLPGQIPSYVVDEAAAVAAKVRAVQNARTFTTLVWADPHHCGTQDSGWREQTNEGSLHAAMGAACVAHACKLDLIAHCGDYTFGNGSTTLALFREQCRELDRYMDQAFGGIPQLVCVGNHDTGEYYLRDGDGGALYGAAEIYDNITYRNAASGAEPGRDIYDYCYKDFAEKKVRVIVLDTVEGEITGGYTGGQCSDAQLLWLAQRLYEIGASADWHVLILGHYPLDYGGTYPAANLLQAYAAGSSVTINETTVDFSGHNSARIAAQYHGHTHCLKVAKLNKIVNGSATEFNVWRLGTPSGNYYRNNDYAGTPIYGIEFGEETTYSKSADSGDDTAFVVNIYDPDAAVIYSICYGAGRDRVVSLGQENYHRITNELTNCANSNGAAFIADGVSYAATVAANAGYTLGTVTVTMGGVDISASAVSGGAISIAEVTGDLVITAAANKEFNYTNQVDNAVNNGGASAPYENGKSLNSSGTSDAHKDYCLTGFIPLSDGSSDHVYRIGGKGISWAPADTYNRIAWYDSSFALLKSPIAADKINSSNYFPRSIHDTGYAYIAFEVVNDQGYVVSNVPASAAYFRIGAKGSGANLIVTLDEEIDDI